MTIGRLFNSPSAVPDGLPFTFATKRHRAALALLVTCVCICATCDAQGSADEPNLVVDNDSSATSATGTWKVSAGANPYGEKSLYSSQSGTYTFSLDVPQSGNYEVLLWWTTYSTTSSKRRTDVPVDITHAGGTATVSVDQQHDGGQWNSLGTWAFDGTATITLHSLGGGTTSADAVKLVPVTDSAPVVMDDNDAATTATGTWKVSAGANPYGEKSLYSSQSGTYTFSLDVPQSGNYEVLLWWTTYSTTSSKRRTDVPVDITHAGGTATVSVDQQHDGGQWNSLGTWAFDGTATITLHSLGGGTTSADAVKLVPKGGDTNAPVITLSGANPVTIELGRSYIDPGVTAVDNVDGDLTAFIVIDDTGVNTASIGTYTVTYSVPDSSGNTAQVTRAVEVVDLLSEVRAFPGAVGYGRDAKGGRGGVVCEVTNLNDRGPGSLRHCAEMSGPRTVVFRVGGTITLESYIPIYNPYITIAGQTAPGDGITIKTNGYARAGVNNMGVISVNTHDVVIRFLRIRPAPSQNDEWVDCIFLSGGSRNVVIDHVSGSWGSKDIMQAWWGSHDVTLQNNILSESLKTNGHKGMLVGGRADRITIYGNLFAHDESRNPLVTANQHDPTDVAFFQVINNVIYNWSWGPSQVGGYSIDTNVGITNADWISNYYKKGPNSNERYEVLIPLPDRAKIYAEGNIGPHRLNDTLDGWNVVGRGSDPIPQTSRSKKRLTTAFVPIVTAANAYDQVLANAGATKPRRDAIDVRVVNDVVNGTGRIIDKPSDVGGWLNLKGGIAPDDSDHDGMPDAWEIAHGVDPRDGADRNHVSPSGYTWLEVYLNSLVVDTFPVGSAGAL